MSTSTKVELPSRFTLPALAELKSILDEPMQARSDIVLDGSAVSSVDSAALQLLLVVQHAVDSRLDRSSGSTREDDEGNFHQDYHQLSVLHSPSPTLSDALQEYGVLNYKPDTTDSKR